MGKRQPPLNRGTRSPRSEHHTQRHSQSKDREEFSIIRVKPELDDVSIKSKQSGSKAVSRSATDKALSRANISLYLDPIPHGVTGVVRRMMSPSPSPCSAPSAPASSRILVLVAHVLGHHRHPVGQSRAHGLAHPVPVAMIRSFGADGHT